MRDIFKNLFTVGIKSIDKQHEVLLQITNELNAAIELDSSKTEIESIVKKLFQYTIDHFRHEESFMDSYPDYPKLIFHKDAHRQTYLKLVELQKSMETGSTIDSNALLWFLREWLTEHILRADKDFGKFLKFKGVK